MECYFHQPFHLLPPAHPSTIVGACEKHRFLLKTIYGSRQAKGNGLSTPRTARHFDMFSQDLTEYRQRALGLIARHLPSYFRSKRPLALQAVLQQQLQSCVVNLCPGCFRSNQTPLRVQSSRGGALLWRWLCRVFLSTWSRSRKLTALSPNFTWAGDSESHSFYSYPRERITVWR